MDERLALAEIAVVVGANVQPGQVVQVTAVVDQLDLARAVADAAYRRGARFVDVQFRDPVLQRSLVLHGPAEAYVPAWRDAPVYGIDDVQGARIMIVGPTVRRHVGGGYADRGGRGGRGGDGLCSRLGRGRLKW